MPHPIGLALLSCSFLLSAAGVAPSAGGPRLRFDRTSHDFGTIRSDSKQSVSWPYHNDGTGPLEIISTRPSCGCTATAVDPKVVPAGASGTLSVTFDPAGQSGEVRKTVTVITNDSSHPNTILTLRAKVIPSDAPAIPGGHPVFTGQSLLMGSCAGCHAAPARGKSGAALWDAVCAMCHGPKAQGHLAPGLRARDYLAAHDDAALGQAIAYGTPNPRMPGFADLMGGPLDANQVASLVRLLRSWGPAPDPAPAPAGSSPPAGSRDGR